MRGDAGRRSYFYCQKAPSSETYVEQMADPLLSL